MQNSKGELEDILERIRSTIWLEKITVIAFLFLIFLGTAFGKFAHPENAKIAIVLLIIWILGVYLFGFLISKQKKAKRAENLFLVHTIINVFFMTLITYYFAGGVEWIGSIFYLFMIVYAGTTISRSKTLIVSTASIIGYSSVVILEYFGLIPFRPYSDLEIKLYQNQNHVLTNLMFVTATYYLIGLAASSFTDLLEKRNLELKKARLALDESKNVLEVKIRARTKELEELVQALEEKVKKRTRELQERVAELEKFQKLAVGRELKMVELKKEIEKLKEELAKYKKHKGRK